MFLFRSLPIYLLLLTLQGFTDGEAKPASGNAKRKLPRLVRRVQAGAARRTHSLARDLRVAFGGILPRDEGPYKPVVYCKGGNQGVITGGGNAGGGSTSTSAGNGTTGGSSRTTTRGGSTSTSSSTRPTSPPQTSNTPTTPASPWGLLQSYEGDSFFQGFNFWTGDDPTHGVVQYLTEADGRARNLVQVNSAGNAIMRVDTTPRISGNRPSVRIETKATYTGGLVVLDALHMPTGCGTWPAFWSNGPDPWPETGEIDILEGVNDNTNNQATLHTSVGCTIPSSSSDSLGISGTLLAGTDCAVQNTDNRGCGVRAATSNSYGRGFNSNQGGVYAMKWDGSGISIYFFPRGSIPDDIDSGNPLPDTWGAPQAKWPGSTCDPFKFFKQHRVIINTTFCGDWAAAVWSAAGSPGQEQSCAQRTGFSTCEEFVRTSGPEAFSEAYWEIRNVKIYQLRN